MISVVILTADKLMGSHRCVIQIYLDWKLGGAINLTLSEVNKIWL